MDYFYREACLYPRKIYSPHGRTARRQAIGRLEVDALEEAAGDDIGQADAVGVDDVFIRLGCGWHPTFLGQTMGEHSRRPVVEKVEDSVIHMPKSFVLVKYRVPLQKLLERMES